MQMTLAAEFYAGTRSKAPVLDIVRIGNGNREQVETIHVINKREARTIAKAMGATPWNFRTPARPDELKTKGMKHDTRNHERAGADGERSEARSIRQECVSTCRSRSSPYQ